MKRIYISELENYYNQEIEVSGFVENIRNLQWVQFVILRDITGKVQITIEKSEEKNKELVELISHLTNESTIKVTGTILESPKVKLGGKEIIPTKIEVTSTCLATELPINVKDKEASLLDARLEIGHGRDLIE